MTIRHRDTSEINIYTFAEKREFAITWEFSETLDDDVIINRALNTYKLDLTQLYYDEQKTIIEAVEKVINNFLVMQKL